MTTGYQGSFSFDKGTCTSEQQACVDILEMEINGSNQKDEVESIITRSTKRPMDLKKNMKGGENTVSTEEITYTMQLRGNQHQENETMITEKRIQQS
jgi:hypothetical protein